MPNRILRADILASERVNRLSIAAECFYRRLMSIVDDYGRYHGNFTLLRSSCFPLRIDSVKEKDITKWLEECEQVGILFLYTINDRYYLEIDNFGQQLRSKSKYPDPAQDGATEVTCKQMISNVSKCTLSRSRIRSRISEREKGDIKCQPKASKGNKLVRDMSDEEYLVHLSKNPKYGGIDIKKETAACQEWCVRKSQTFSRKRLTTWLEKAEAPMKLRPREAPMRDARGNVIERVV